MARHSIGGLEYTGPARVPAKGWLDRLTHLDPTDRHQIALQAINTAVHPAQLERQTREAFAADATALRSARAA